jgi:riboflavin kinase/FMN adenylyltransferase
VKTFEGPEAFVAPPGGTAVAVGVFDGFHLGHGSVIRLLLSTARELAARSCVLTFRTHPRKVLDGSGRPLVTSFEHRLVLLERAGVEAAVEAEFTPRLASLAAERFVKDVLAERLRARAVVLGPDARMGRGGEADPARVREIARPLGIKVRVAEPVLLGGDPVSSTRVRAAIEAGDLASAEALLGRRVSVLGTVVPGSGRGRTLGFPTANLDVHHEVRPPHGVYASWMYAAEGCLASVTNVGFRPTFVESGAPEGAGERRIETHLLEPPTEPLYGCAVEVEFVERLRDERPFESDEALARQIARDVEAAREALKRT